jgi:glutamyl-tRNA reductase
VDLCLPRNVDPAVREVPGVRVVDLADLRDAGIGAADVLAEDVEYTSRVVEEATAQYVGWLAGRSASAAVRRMRADAEALARAELLRAGREHDTVFEHALRRTVNRLLHGPTRALVAACQTGDDEQVNLLANLFAPSARPNPDAAAQLGDTALGSERSGVRAGEQALDERARHPTDQVAV